MVISKVNWKEKWAVEQKFTIHFSNCNGKIIFVSDEVHAKCLRNRIMNQRKFEFWEKIG